MPEQEEKNTKETRLQKVLDLHRSVEFGSTDLFERMRKAADMTYRDQWDAADRKHREDANKFVLSVPLIKPQIKQVVGQQVENPKELSVVANRSGSRAGANILTKLAKHAQDTEYARFQKTHWFEAGLANNVGFIGVFIDKNTDPRHGNLIIEKLNEFECGLDPNCNVYDFNSFHHGAKCFIWEPWIDKEWIHAQYPNAKNLKNSSAKISGSDPTGVFAYMKGAASRIRRAFSTSPRSVQDTLEEFKYHVTHTWYRKPKRVIMLYDTEGEELDAQLIVKDKEIRQAKKMASESGRFEVEEVVRNIMHHHIRVGREVLEEIEDELNGVDMYPVVGYSGYFDNGYRGGMSEDLVGTQQEINFLHSTRMDLFKKLPNVGYIIAKDIGDYAAELEETGGQDGVVLVAAKAGGKIEKIKPTEIPPSLDRAEETAIRNISLTSGVRTENPQNDAAELSGKAIIAKQQASQTGNAPVILNFDYSQMILNNLIVAVIRANGIYSKEEIIEIIGEDELINSQLLAEARQIVQAELSRSGLEVPQEPPALNLELARLNPAYVANYMADVESVKESLALIDKIAVPIAQDLLIEEISNLTRGTYNTTVAAVAYTPSMKTAEFAQLLELQELQIKTGGAPIPHRRLILASDARDAEQIVDEMDRAQQQQAVAG